MEAHATAGHLTPETPDVTIAAAIAALADPYTGSIPAWAAPRTRPVAARPRDPAWPAVRDAFLAGRTCAACGRAAELTAHHVEPVHLFPGRELDPANLLALCEWPAGNCHLLFGHLGRWDAWNPDAARDAAWYLARRAARRLV